MTARTWSTLVLVFASGLVALAQEAARPSGIGGIISEVPATPFDKVCDAAEFVAQGVLLNSRVVTVNRRQYTDFEFRPSRVLLRPEQVRNPRPGIVPPIVVRFAGGTTILDGQVVKTVHMDFPVPQVGSEVVLFLRKAGDGSYWEPVADAYGVFKSLNGRIEIIPKAARTHTRYRGMPIATFHDEVIRCIKKR